MFTNAYYHLQVQSCQRFNLWQAHLCQIFPCFVTLYLSMLPGEKTSCEDQMNTVVHLVHLMSLWNTSSSSANEGLCLWVCVYLTAIVPVFPSSRDSSAHRLSISVPVIFTLIWKQGEVKSNTFREWLERKRERLSVVWATYMSIYYWWRKEVRHCVHVSLRFFGNRMLFKCRHVWNEQKNHSTHTQQR
jgi:hypothetical protein